MRALASLDPQSCLKQLDRAVTGAPVWPEGVTGSITHTDHFAPAAVATTARTVSPGSTPNGSYPVSRRTMSGISWLLPANSGTARPRASCRSKPSRSSSQRRNPSSSASIQADVAVQRLQQHQPLVDRLPAVRLIEQAIHLCPGRPEPAHDLAFRGRALGHSLLRFECSSAQQQIAKISCSLSERYPRNIG